MREHGAPTHLLTGIETTAEQFDVFGARLPLSSRSIAGVDLSMQTLTPPQIAQMIKVAEVEMLATGRAFGANSVGMGEQVDDAQFRTKDCSSTVLSE